MKTDDPDAAKESRAQAWAVYYDALIHSTRPPSEMRRGILDRLVASANLRRSERPVQVAGGPHAR